MRLCGARQMLTTRTGWPANSGLDNAQSSAAAPGPPASSATPMGPSGLSADSATTTRGQRTDPARPTVVEPENCRLWPLLARRPTTTIEQFWLSWVRTPTGVPTATLV